MKFSIVLNYLQLKILTFIDNKFTNDKSRFQLNIKGR